MIPDQIGVVLNALKKVGVDYNVVNPNYFGVTFKDNMAIAASASFIVLIEGLTQPAPGEFYSYLDENWGPNRYNISFDGILKILTDLMPKHIGKLIVPLPNLINHIDTLTDAEKTMSRVIIAPDIVPEGDMLMKFDWNGSDFEFRHRLLPKPCILASNPKIPKEYINPNLIYKTHTVDEDGTAFYVDAYGLYSKVKIGLYHSTSGFIPKDMDRINAMVDLPESRILRVNQIEPDKDFRMVPTHLKCTMFYDLIKTLALSGNPFVEIFVADDANIPIVMKNVRMEQNGFQITVMQATMNPFYGPQRC
jgi:hypothetical protein